MQTIPNPSWRSLSLGVLAVRFVGAVFLVSALLKALDTTQFAVQIASFGLIKTPWLVKDVAVALVAIEATLGALLLLQVRPRRMALFGAMAMLGAFSILLTWAWLFTDLKDCGCFGKYVKVSPGAGVFKNAVLIALGAWGGRKLRRSGGEAVRYGAGSEGRARRLSLAAPAAAALLVTGTAAFTATESAAGPGGEADRPSAGASRPSPERNEGKLGKYAIVREGETVDLSRGEYLVALLSDSCEHCAEMMPELNRMAQEPGHLPVVALMMGREDTYAQFLDKHKPRFATTLIPVLEFFELIGEAPPRFYFSRDGVPVRTWDKELPPPEALRQEMRNAALPG